MWDILPETGVRNDSTMSLPRVNDLLERDGIEVQYQGIVVVAQRGAMDDARRFAAEIKLDHRADVLRDLERRLSHEARKNKIMKGRSPRRVGMFYEDVLLWRALRELRALSLGPAI